MSKKGKKVLELMNFLLQNQKKGKRKKNGKLIVCQDVWAFSLQLVRTWANIKWMVVNGAVQFVCTKIKGKEKLFVLKFNSLIKHLNFMMNMKNATFGHALCVIIT